MCGYVGFTGTFEGAEEALSQMMDTIVHRGPDSDGTHIDSHIALGFRRLSIIGLEDGAQPIYNEDGSKVIVFNGEIYNYQTIKDELISLGHAFRTHADTEVLIHGYEQWGEGLLEKVRGMFSFAIWDLRRRELFFARDFFGIKPLYYAQIAGELVFGSEIKSFLKYPSFKKELNEQALESYLTFQYSGLPETFFKGVFRVPPAHCGTWSKDRGIKIKRYWEPVFAIDEEMTLEAAVDKIDDVFLDSVAAHKIADVEVGSFLSSGVDSSYAAATFKGDKTFTVGFDFGKYYDSDKDETGHARELSKEIGIENHSKTISTDEYWDTFPKIQCQMDEPLADPSAAALYFVSQEAAKHVKVVLSGEGADELFGGYNIYRQPMDIKRLTSLPLWLRKALAGLAGFLPEGTRGKNMFIRGAKSIEESFIGNAQPPVTFSVEERKRLLKHDAAAPLPTDITAPIFAKVADLDDVSKMQYLDIHTWLWGDILLKADRMSMAHSLELRVPFLDKEVCKVAMTIPTKYKVNHENTKYAMRLAALRHIPQKVADRPKLGFPVPVKYWLREQKYYDIIASEFVSPTAEKYFDTTELMHILDEHHEGKRDNARKIWIIHTFLVWHRSYFEEAA